jgi:hypothetical protein
MARSTLDQVKRGWEFILMPDRILNELTAFIAGD